MWRAEEERRAGFSWDNAVVMQAVPGDTSALFKAAATHFMGTPAASSPHTCHTLSATATPVSVGMCGCGITGRARHNQDPEETARRHLLQQDPLYKRVPLSR
ncbi:hypothetical protein E2C01_024357 [Portunus trituberculatus]|uniref:Uncharacterized protein n=1 Tax=Portunus trituberculatus TaxID=210409 RepID=A0A5B7EA50_PORTR|nr:hypothetical protein [Portunus trituberculatus]